MSQIIGISSSGKNIIAGFSPDIYYSINNGNNFTQKQISTTQNETFNGISITDNGYGIISSSLENVYITSDYYNTWSSPTTLITNNNNILGVTISNNGQYMFVATVSNTIYKSIDYGNNFTQKTISNNITSITSFAMNDQYILATTNAGIYISSDLGDTWILNINAPTNVTWCSICINQNGFAIACTQTNIYVSTNNGGIWVNKYQTTIIKKAITSKYGYGIVLTNTNILITMNYGDTWNEWNNWNTVPTISTINDISVSKNGVLVVCTNQNKIYTTSIYSIYNANKTFTSVQAGFVTQGLLTRQLVFPLITNNQINVQINTSSTAPDYYTLFICNDINRQTDFSNITILPNNNGSFNAVYNYNFTDLSENALYDISFQAFYPGLPPSLLTQKIYTKSKPTNFIYDISSVTDVSMNISFTPCLNIPLSYNIRIINQENPNNNYFIPIISNSTNTIEYTITSLTNDSNYILYLDASYVDFSYNAVDQYSFSTKSTPKNGIIKIKDFQSVDLSFNEPKNTTPDSFTIFLDHLLDTNNPNKNVQVIDVSMNKDKIPPITTTLSQQLVIEELVTNTRYQVRLQSNYPNMQIQTPPIIFNATPVPTVNIYYQIEITGTYSIITTIDLPLFPLYYLLTIYYPDQNDVSYNETVDCPVQGSRTIYPFININYNTEEDIVYNNTYDIEVSAVYSLKPYYYVSNTKTISIAKTTRITYNNVLSDISYIEIPFYINITDITNQYYLNLKNSAINDLSYVYNIPSTESNLYGSHTFSNLYINSGTYEYFVTNSEDINFKTDTNYITLNNTSTVQIDSITQTKKINIGNRLNIIYTILQPNTYKPYYTLYIINTVNTDISYSSTTYQLLDSSFNINVNITGDYNIYVTNYYENGYIQSNIIPTTITIIPDVSFGDTDISFSYITIPYSILSYITNPLYTISISGCISAFDLSAQIIPTSNSSYANTSTPIYYSASTTFPVYANTGTYYYKITDGINTFFPVNNSFILPTVQNQVYNLSYTFTDTSFVVYYNYIVTYLPTYTVYLKNQTNSDIYYDTSTNYSIPLFSLLDNNNINNKMTILNICRSGNYNYYITHNYKTNNVVNNGITNKVYNTPQININIKIPNTVSFFPSSVMYDLSASDFFGIDISYQTIKIPFQITSYDINPLNYTLYLQNTSINELDYSYNFTFEKSTDYNNPTIYSSDYTFTEIYINSGIYRYYIQDSNDISYNTGVIYPTSYSTFSFSNVSSKIYTTSASISANISIIYPCYNSTYTFLAVSSTRPDISFSSIYDASAIIHNNKINYSNTNTLIIDNVTRSDIYNLKIIHNYNNITSPSVETSSIYQTNVSILYDVSFTNIRNTNGLVNISYTITSFMLTNINYYIYILKKDGTLNYSTNQYTIGTSNDLTKGVTISNTISFTMSKGTYDCYVYFQNIQYGPYTSFTI